MNQYHGVITRFLRDEERFILSEEHEMPLVIEADNVNSLSFLHQFLAGNADQLINDMAHYGAVLLRGFSVNSAEEFEQTVLSVPQFCGIREALMSENGRVPVGGLNYVLHTNSVYKTGGTLYLGGFHTENYYSPDVPSYICFYCQEPSVQGGETGLINTEKMYRSLSSELKDKLEQNTFFVTKWLVSEVADRYQVDSLSVEKMCQAAQLPLVGEGKEALILMYKPCVFIHPLTHEKALQINLFELPKLNAELRTCFINDYKGTNWFCHRVFWRLPAPVFNSLEVLAVMMIAFFHSPKNSFKILRAKYAQHLANLKAPSYNARTVGSCFSDHDTKALAQTMRTNYSSCIWKKGDILLIDNKKVMHAGMPGSGTRIIRAMICNPLALDYTSTKPGCIKPVERKPGALGDSILKTL
jgi:alpha-ketoglutarate-dependent taurine dioxygenase